jgi:hypothetical protein
MQEESLLQKKELVTCSFKMTKDICLESKTTYAPLSSPLREDWH